MNPSLLPPRGIFIPTQMIFFSKLPSAVITTWIQLRALAWKGRDSPALTIQELAAITGKSCKTLNNHISKLNATGVIQLNRCEHGKVIVSFPEQRADNPKILSQDCERNDQMILNSKNSELPASCSYFPSQILGYLTYQTDQVEFPDFKEV